MHHLDLNEGTGINISLDTASDPAIASYTISSPGAVDFKDSIHSVSLDDRDEVDILAGDGISVGLTDPSGVATYTIAAVGGVSGNTEFKSGTQTEKVGHTVNLNAAAGSGLDITLTQPATNEALYEFSVVESDLDRSTVTQGAGITVTAGAPDATTGAIDYIITDPTISFFLDGVDSGQDKAGIDLVPGTDIAITKTDHSDRFVYTIGFLGQTGADIDFNSGTQTAVTDATEVDIDSITGSGIDILLTEPTPDDALYSISVDQDELARTTVSAASGSGISVTAGTANASTGVIDYALELVGLDFWLGGVNQNVERPGLDLVGGNDITITADDTDPDKVAYTFAFSGTAGSPEFDSGAQTAVAAPDTVNIEGIGAIDIALTETPPDTARYRVSLDQSGIDRDSVSAGTGITVTAGTPDATTGAIDYTVADSGDDISFYLGGIDTNIDAEGVGLRAGTGVTITGSAQTGHYEYTINASGGGSGNVTFGHAGSSDVVSAEVDVEEGHGIELTLASTSGVATYTVVVDESDLDRTEVSAGNAIDVTAGNANAAGVIIYSVEVDESDLSRTTVVAGSGVTVSAGTTNSDGAIAYTVTDPTDAISFFRNGSDLNVDREGIDLVPGANVTITATEHSDRVAYTINSSAAAASSTVTFKTNGSGSDVVEDEVSLSSVTDSGHRHKLS